MRRFTTTLKAQASRDPAFALALREEAARALGAGETEIARRIERSLDRPDTMRDSASRNS